MTETAVFLALGSNLGDRAGYLRAAAEMLGSHAGIRVVKESKIYETEPLGPPGQGLYLNAALEIVTTLSARELLDACRKIEDQLGRTRALRWGPRTIDIDILLYGAESIEEPELIVPHPEMEKRRFVLEPLVQLAPGALHPRLGKTAAELLRALEERAKAEDAHGH